MSADIPAWACLACREREAREDVAWLEAPCPKHQPTLTDEDWRDIGSAVEDWDPEEGWNDLSNAIGGAVRHIITRHLNQERQAWRQEVSQ